MDCDGDGKRKECSRDVRVEKGRGTYRFVQAEEIEFRAIQRALRKRVRVCQVPERVRGGRRSVACDCVHLSHGRRNVGKETTENNNKKAKRQGR